MSKEIWQFLLGGGAFAFLLAGGQAIRWLTSRVSAREDKVERQIKDWQRDTVHRATWEARQHDWWRDYAGRLEYVITRELGEDALPRKRPYPRRPQGDTDDTPDPKVIES